MATLSETNNATLGEMLAHDEPIKFRDGRFTLGLKNGESVASGIATETEALMKDLQGNILTWHKRHNAHYFFLKFKQATAEEARTTRLLISALAGAKVETPLDLPGHVKSLKITSEWDLRSPLENGALEEISKSFFVSLLLTGSGYGALGFTNRIAGDEVFLNGMRSRTAELNDPDPAQWKLGRPHVLDSSPETAPDPDVCVSVPQADMDALIILAYDPPKPEDTLNLADRRDTVSAFRKTLSRYSTLVHEEFGRALKSKQEDPKTGRPWYIEPFGYRDGISQPLFYETDRRNTLKLSDPPEGKTDFDSWDPKARLGLVLVPDPNGNPYSCGSFFVYRKLKQDVKGFYEQAKKLEAFAGDGKVFDLQAVLGNLMGRRLDGSLPGNPHGEALSNDFDFKNDQYGSKCPFHSHIRKVSPRSDARGDDFRSWRIARRALSFGVPMDRDPDNMPSFVKDAQAEKPVGDHGLHFMCAQSDIAGQFEHIQAKWTNQPKAAYLGGNAGMDVISGQAAGGSENKILFPQKAEGVEPEKWPRAPFDYRQSVTFLGGEYFYAPCISSLKGLAP